MAVGASEWASLASLPKYERTLEQPGESHPSPHKAWGGSYIGSVVI